MNFKVIHKYQLIPYDVTTHPVYGVSCFTNLPVLPLETISDNDLCPECNIKRCSSCFPILWKN